MVHRKSKCTLIVLVQMHFIQREQNAASHAFEQISDLIFFNASAGHR